MVDPVGEGIADPVQDGTRTAANTLDDAGYAVDEAEPPSTAAAATSLLDMLIPGMRAGWETFAPLVRPYHRQFVESLFEAAVNALGLPAVAVPVGVEDGLPQAVQVIGPRYREDLCLDAAVALEEPLGIITPIDGRGSAGPGRPPDLERRGRGHSG